MIVATTVLLAVGIFCFLYCMIFHFVLFQFPGCSRFFSLHHKSAPCLKFELTFEDNNITFVSYYVDDNVTLTFFPARSLRSFLAEADLLRFLLLADFLPSLNIKLI